MKNYIGFVNDHSGSMMTLASAAIQDYNANIEAVKSAASREMLDTVVSVVGVGLPGVGSTKRQVVISNPHVLKPVSDWPTPGDTPLWDGIGDMINLLKDLPDAGSPDVSFLLMITTDGAENGSFRFSHSNLKSLIQQVSLGGNWTFVFRMPAQTHARYMQEIRNLGVPEGNIQFWNTTAAGMAESTAKTTQAMDTFFTARSAGAKSTSAFYADASQVNVAALTDISKKVSLYVVPDADNGIEIRPFVLRHRMEYLKGAAFYQLTKTESRVSHTKQILVRDQATGKVFAGAEARKMIGLPTNANARLHPGDHKNFDLFIQSESVNRKLVGGSGVIYWKEIGVQFTQEELDRFQPKPTAPAVPPVVQLPKVPVSNKPTKSPIPVTPQFQFFTTRDEARMFCGAHGIPQSSILNNPGAIKGRRWSVPVKLVNGVAKSKATA